MEDTNELSDIVLEKSDGKALKVKRILIIIAILIIIFLAVLVSMKMLNKPTQNEASKFLLPPAPIASVENSTKNEEMFKQVPIIEQNNTKNDSFTNMVKSLKAKELAKTNLNKVKVEKTTNKQVKKLFVAQPVVKPIAPIVKKVVSKLPIKNTAKAIKGIYIQVAATSKYKPSKKFLKLITDKKYTYKLLPISVNGKKVIKILVGPFKDINDAKKNIISIRKSINKNAFIYRVK